MIRFTVEAPDAAAFEAVMMTLGRAPAPKPTLLPCEQTFATIVSSPLLTPVDVPAKRGRPAKSAEPLVAVAEIVPVDIAVAEIVPVDIAVAEIVPVEIVPVAVAVAEVAKVAHVELPSAPTPAPVITAASGGLSPEELGKAVRVALVDVRDRFDGATMLNLIKQYGGASVKDVPPGKLAELLAAAQSLVAVP